MKRRLFEYTAKDQGSGLGYALIVVRCPHQSTAKMIAERELTRAGRPELVQDLKLTRSGQDNDVVYSTIESK